MLLQRRIGALQQLRNECVWSSSTRRPSQLLLTFPLRHFRYRELPVRRSKRILQLQNPRYGLVLALAALKHGGCRRGQVANFVQLTNTFRACACLAVQNFAVTKNGRQFVNYVMCKKAEVVPTKFVHGSAHILALDGV